MTVRHPFSGRFVLRDNLLGSVHDHVENGITQIRIVGGVGSGKTSLALQFLYQPFVHGRFPRGPVYISLAEPNFAAAITLMVMDARLRKTRVSNFAQTAYLKGEDGYSAPGAGDNRGPTIRFSLAQINLGAPRDGYIVVLDDVFPLKTLNGGDSTRDLMINEIERRVKAGNIKEVILATNAGLEGDTTGIYIRNLLAGYHVRVTKLARGLSVGADLEYADLKTLSHAFAGRS